MIEEPASVADLKAKVQQYPNFEHFQENSTTETRLIAWLSGRCFMWYREEQTEEWRCVEI